MRRVRDVVVLVLVFLALVALILGVGIVGVAGGAPGDPPAQDRPLPCIRHIESRGNYQAHGVERRNGRTHHYWGAYQFDQSTWNSNAAAGPHTDWVGVRPDQAPIDIQDSQARVTVHRRGLQPWPPARGCQR